MPGIPEQPGADTNSLFPVFLKLETLRLLIVGGGYAGMEKLQAVLQNSPAASICLVASVISKDIKELAAQYDNIRLLEKSYDIHDLEKADLVIVAVNDMRVSGQVQRDARARRLLVNVADQPGLCDFYLSSVVKKGNLKIAISTNGKSPTIAKRLKEVFTEMIPDEIDQVLHDMQAIRQKLGGDFSEKIKQLNALTKVLVAGKTSADVVEPIEPDQKDD